MRKAKKIIFGIGIVIAGFIALVLAVGSTITDEAKKDEKIQTQPIQEFQTLEEATKFSKRAQAAQTLVFYKGKDGEGTSLIKTVFTLRKVLEPDLTPKSFDKYSEWGFSEDENSDIQTLVIYYTRDSFNDEYWFQVDLRTNEVKGLNELGKSMIEIVDIEGSVEREPLEEPLSDDEMIDPEIFCTEDTKWLYEFLELEDLYEKKAKEICA